MPEEVRLWRIQGGDTLLEIARSPLDFEARLEVWLECDISVLSPGLLVIGRQVETDFGGFIDLLCLDRAGDVVVVELKRNKTPREVTAQILDYGSWVRDLSNERITATTRSSIGFTSLFKGSRKTVVSFIPQQSNASDGLRFQLYSLRLRNLFNLSADSDLSMLPSRRDPWIYYETAGPDYEGFQGFFGDSAEVDRFMDGIVRLQKAALEGLTVERSYPGGQQ